MKLLGLTGGIGMGKSTSASILQQSGLAVVDTDRLAREVVEPGRPALEEIKTHFGSAVIGEDGRLLRAELARLVFADEQARWDLEQILHPRIRALWLEQAEQWRGENRSAGVVVIPLLFETGAEASFQARICVACSLETQRERLSQRGWSESQIHNRIQAQWPIEKKMLAADYVVWTESNLEIHAEQLRRILRSESVYSG